MGDIGDIWRERDAHRRAKKAGGQAQNAPKDKPHACDQCKRRFGDALALQNHRKDAHGIKPPAKPQDDGETMGDFWRDVKPVLQAESQQRRAENRADGAALLQHEGIPFTTNNGGAHLIVSTPRGLVDYWPGTGLWIARVNKKRCRGVRGLIDFYEQGA